MKKINIFIRIGLLLLIATLATSGVFIGSGTYSKYIASANVSAEAKVAKFDVRVNGTDPSTNQIVKAGGVAATITLTNVGALLQPPGMATHSTATISTTNGSIIAPGTAGKMSFTVYNYSEVAIDVWFATASTSPTIPSNSGIVFCNASGVAYSNFAAALDAIGVINLGPGSVTTTNTGAKDIYWQWPFNNDNDANDTTLGVAGTAKLEIPFVVKAEQAD